MLSNGIIDALALASTGAVLHTNYPLLKYGKAGIGHKAAWRLRDSSHTSSIRR